jgi:hypothetical protein
MPLRRVASSEFDGTVVTTSFGSTEVDAAEASYGDSIETGNYVPMGSQGGGRRTRGVYKTEEWTVKMSSYDFRTVLIPAFPTNGAGNVVFSLTINRRHPDLGDDSDMLESCRCLNWSDAVKNSSEVEMIELKGTVQQIYWTDARITINLPDGTEQGTANL